MNHPVKIPREMPIMILAQLTAFVAVSIFSPFLAIAASLDPTNIAIKSLGVAAAVARAKDTGVTVGNVDMPALERL